MNDIGLKKHKILCIGDSLTLPGHGNQFEDTWFYKLQEHFSNHVFASFFKRSSTVEILVTEGGGIDSFPKGSDCLEFFMPDIVILQLGIVDCAPRYLKRSGLIFKLLERIPEKLKKSIYFIIKKVRTRSVNKADVTPNQFRHFINSYLVRCEKNKVKKVIFIKICTPDEKVQSKSPELITSIDIYNKIIDDVVSNYENACTIHPLNKSLSELYEDGYHPNPKGNDLVYKKLVIEIDLV
jgi:lysophospholipase L1-like esterase